MIKELMEKFSTQQGKKLLMVLLIIALMVVSISIFFLNNGLFNENKKMVKYIKRTGFENERYRQLVQTKNLQKKYYDIILTGKKPNKKKDEYYTILSRRIKDNRMIEGFYSSNHKKEADFYRFQYNFKIYGNYQQLISFLTGLNRDYKYFYLKELKAKRASEKYLEILVQLEALGMGANEKQAD